MRSFCSRKVHRLAKSKPFFNHPDGTAMGFEKPTQPFLDVGRVGQDPAIDCAMVNFKAVLKLELFGRNRPMPSISLDAAGGTHAPHWL